MNEIGDGGFKQLNDVTQTNIVDFQVACVDEAEGDLTQSRPSLLKTNPGASSL